MSEIITVTLDVTICGYSIPSQDIDFEISEFEGMSEDERSEYIYKQSYDYIVEQLEVGVIDE